MSSNERLNLSEQDNGNLTGWEEVSAMADKMPAEESTNNLIDDEENDTDGIIDTSGRKYQTNYERAESINSENTRAYNIDRRNKNYQMLLEKDKDLADLYKGILTEFPDLNNVELINFDTRRETKDGKPNAFFSSLAMKNGQYRPIVKFNFNEPEVYFDGTEGGGDALSLAQSVKKIAMKVGVDANEALKNKKFMTYRHILKYI
jgi:hypothetical protein